jgi:hypothetical protein
LGAAILLQIGKTIAKFEVLWMSIANLLVSWISIQLFFTFRCTFHLLQTIFIPEQVEYDR